MRKKVFRTKGPYKLTEPVCKDILQSKLSVKELAEKHNIGVVSVYTVYRNRNLAK